MAQFYSIRRLCEWIFQALCVGAMNKTSKAERITPCFWRNLFCQVMFFKVNTLGEQNFLNTLDAAIDQWIAQHPQG